MKKYSTSKKIRLVCLNSGKYKIDVVLNFIIPRSGEKAVIQLFVHDQSSKYIQYILKCPIKVNPTNGLNSVSIIKILSKKVDNAQENLICWMLMLQSKLYIPSNINIWKKVLTKAISHWLYINLNDQKTSHFYWGIPGMLETSTIPK